MSRILVADDNSNIQKMVALALKDEGIDVVAVGNGEAAMRRIPDLRPDLVLADIFMPVRNGYEVCEFVKSDSRYMSTPVVLLVGAFDPLDEQETQRVRADGVLKKPFVPPDPLINMVKALLAKSNGQKAMPVQTPIQPKAAAPSQPAPAQATTTPASQPSAVGQIATAPPEQLVQQQTVVSAPVPPAPPAVFVPPARHIPAPTANTDDSDEVVTASRDPNLGEPFWATPAEPAQEKESESEDETQPADMLDMHSFGKDESSIEEEQDERSHFRPDSSLLDIEFRPDSSAGNVSQNDASPQPANSSQFELTDENESDSSVAQTGKEAPSSAPSEPPAEVFKFDPTLTFAPSTQDAPVEQESTEETPQNVDPEPLELTASDEAAPLPWPAVTESPAEAPASTEKPRADHEPIASLELELPALPNRDAVITAATEAARLAFSELNTLPGSGPSGGSPDRDATDAEHKLPASGPSGVPASPTPEMIDAVVSRLLERMQPQIMEVVNREVLRPAIEAIVRREMKKS